MAFVVTEAYKESLAAITVMVYETMLGIDVAAGDGWTMEPEFTAAVHYAGAWQGAMLLSCTKRQAYLWAGRLMQLDGPVDNEEDARDGLGELANMLAGNLKPLLPPGVGLSLPLVAAGRGHRLKACGTPVTHEMSFVSQEGPFRITFLEPPKE